MFLPKRNWNILPVATEKVLINRTDLPADARDAAVAERLVQPLRAQRELIDYVLIVGCSFVVHTN